MRCVNLQGTYSIGTYFQVYKSFKRGTLFGQMEEKWKFMKDWHRKKQKVLPY